jgi:non-lysosomal glucosylceramidase
MNGFEYAAAIHMIMNGLVDEGMTAVAAIRHRYDGERRNPWNEFECGSNYARSMASYALLNAFSGFEFDMTSGYLGFSPLVGEGHFRTFWSLESGWGEFESAPQRADLRLLYGELILKRLRLPAGMVPRAAAVEGRAADFTVEEGVLIFADPLPLKAGQTLTIHCGDGDHA